MFKQQKTLKLFTNQITLYHLNCDLFNLKIKYYNSLDLFNSIRCYHNSSQINSIRYFNLCQINSIKCYKSNLINLTKYYQNSNLINSTNQIRNYYQLLNYTRRLYNNNSINLIRQLTYYERKLANELKKDNDELTDELLKSSKLTDELLKSSPTTKLYETHQQLNNIQTILLAIGSSIGALIDPYRDGKNIIFNFLIYLT